MADPAFIKGMRHAYVPFRILGFKQEFKTTLLFFTLLFFTIREGHAAPHTFPLYIHHWFVIDL